MTGGERMPRGGDDVIALTRRLVAIDATNPSLSPGGAGEGEIARFIAAWLRERGVDARLVGPDATRPSVLARRRGTGGGPALMLAGHLDTVGGRGDAVTVAAADPDRIVGRGAYDMAGGLAAAMIAAVTAPHDLAGDLVLAFAADEEFGSAGMEALLAAIDDDAAAHPATDARPTGAIVLEPTDLEVTLAHRGFAWYRVEYEGVAAHGSQPERGVDAIERALDGLNALRALGAEIAARPRHPLLGAGSARVATIDGGTDAATVADQCVLVVERRTLPGDPDPAAELERVLAPSGPTRVEPLVVRPAMEADADAPVARAVIAAVGHALGAPAVRRGDPWWTDAGLIADAGIPAVLVGPVGGGAHADEEWVSAASLSTLVRVVEEAVQAFCRPAGPPGTQD